MKVKLKRNRCIASFDLEGYHSCPRGRQCPVVPGKKHFYLRYDRRAVRLAERRAREETPAFRERYRFRAGIEGNISAYDARTGVKQLRVRGFGTVRFCATLKATGINIFRATVVRRVLREAPESLAGEKSGLCHAIFFKELCGTLWGGLQRFMAPIGTYEKFELFFCSLTFYGFIKIDYQLYRCTAVK